MAASNDLPYDDRVVLRSSTVSALRTFALWYIALLGLWTGAWLLHRHALPPLGAAAERMWWESTKLALWIAPLAAWCRFSERMSWPDALGWPSPTRPLVSPTGGWLAGGWLLLLAVDTAVRGLPEPRFDLTGLRLVTWTPLLEELVFRGLVFESLRRRGVPLWLTSLLTGVAFAGLHVVGWTFMHGFGPALIQSAPLVVFGTVLGLTRAGGASLLAPLVLHAVNNAWVAGLLLGGWQQVAG